MKAAVFYQKNNLKVEERKVPEPGKSQVLVRVRACGVCGTDVHIFCGDEGAAPTPAGTVLGHEFAGEIAAVGPGVTGLSVGARVAVDPNKLCGRCNFCRKGVGHFCENITGIGTTVDGGFAEYCAVPASQVYPVANSLPFEQAAMAEPLSCCLHGVELCGVKSGATVIVIGCGMIGLVMLQLARLSGAANIVAVEPVAEKRQQALNLGANVALDPKTEDIPKVLKQRGLAQVDVVIECVGRSETIEQAIALAGKYSTVMMFGLTKPNAEITVKPFELFKKEITLRSSYINPYTFSAAVRLIETGRVDVASMVYKTAPLSELPGILESAEKRGKGKYIITM